jgi:hypothetical protein
MLRHPPSSSSDSSSSDDEEQATDVLSNFKETIQSFEPVMDMIEASLDAVRERIHTAPVKPFEAPLVPKTEAARAWLQTVCRDTDAQCSAKEFVERVLRRAKQIELGTRHIHLAGEDAALFHGTLVLSLWDLIRCIPTLFTVAPPPIEAPAE